MDYANLQIRDYLFIRRIGTGGMGEVWLGEDSNLERRVAIKILNPVLSGCHALDLRPSCGASCASKTASSF